MVDLHEYVCTSNAILPWHMSICLKGIVMEDNWTNS